MNWPAACVDSAQSQTGVPIMESPYFKNYTRNLTRVLMAEFVDDLSRTNRPSSQTNSNMMSATVADVAHLLPPFPFSADPLATTKS